MSQDTIKLRTGFEIAHGRLEEVVDFLRTRHAFVCPLSIAFLTLAANREEQPSGSYATELGKFGDAVFNDDGLMHEDMAHVVISAAQCESPEAARAELAQAKGCPLLYLHNLTADSE